MLGTGNEGNKEGKRKRREDEGRRGVRTCAEQTALPAVGSPLH